MKKALFATTLLAGMFAASSANAFQEYPIGEAVTMNELEIAAVYLKPIDMEPRGMGLPAAKSDIHLEADIHAVKGNKNGFGDGPHYGANVKMMGVGNYKLTYHIDPPSKAGMHRHTDEETGVGRWWKPFDVSYEFKFTGLK